MGRCTYAYIYTHIYIIVIFSGEDLMQAFLGLKILVENFSKFFFGHIKGNFFFLLFFHSKHVFTHVGAFWGDSEQKSWVYKNRPWGRSLGHNLNLCKTFRTIFFKEFIKDI